MRTRRSMSLVLALLAATPACARGPQISADGLALRRVVVYRNGVGYFERSGVVEGDAVRFRMRQSEVGDFLATLAVIEQGGSSVRSASFPLRTEKPSEPPAPPPEAHPFSPRPVAPAPPAPPPEGDEREPLANVILDLDGKKHDLAVGYIAATPVWRPSYRLVVDAGGADLQAWGIVQNLSGEDWKGVSLALVAGAPLAFEAELGTPVVPDRPVVTDRGEVIAAVPRAETSLDQSQLADALAAPAEAEAPPPEAQAAPAPPSPSPMPGPRGMAALHANGTSGGRAIRAAEPRGAAAPKPAPMAKAAIPAQRSVAPSAPRNLSALAAVAAEGGTTRYELPNAVTVPDGSATMVLLLAKRVPGESVFLFAPDGGVPDSAAHPFRVARFTNQTGGALERGPIAVFEKGSFLGQGMVDPLPPGATATVPFALERSLAVDSSRTRDESGARLAKIEGGALVIERDAVTRTKYRVRNGGDAPAKVLVKHARSPETRLFEPPKGTDDNVGTGAALVPAEVAPRTTVELLVDERQSFQRGVDWLAPLADDAVKAYLADARADAGVVAALRAAWDVRAALVKATEERDRLERERNELSAQSEETRRNLKTIEKNRAADDLRRKLTERLAKASARLDEIGRRRVEVDLQADELRVRFQDAIRSIKLAGPLPAK